MAALTSAPNRHDGKRFAEGAAVRILPDPQCPRKHWGRRATVRKTNPTTCWIVFDGEDRELKAPAFFLEPAS